eukprot:5700783-Alexandrium_andersonii.AAC.1
MQAIKHAEAWPLLAEFEVGEQGGRLVALHEPLEKWDGDVAAVVTCKEHTEPLFFAATGAAEVVARLPVDPSALPAIHPAWGFTANLA